VRAIQTHFPRLSWDDARSCIPSAVCLDDRCERDATAAAYESVEIRDDSEEACADETKASRVLRSLLAKL
jgi:hypothetical protein